MIIFQPAAPIGQPKHARTERYAEPIRQPFSQKINTRFALMSDVGAHVQKRMRGDRPHQPACDLSAKARSHPSQRKRHQTNERFALALVQLKGHLTLQSLSIHDVMEHQRPIPIRQKQRLAPRRKYSLACGGA